MTEEILTTDPLVAAWKSMRAYRPDYMMLGAVLSKNSRDVDTAISLARAVERYVHAIMLRIPEDDDTVH